MEKSVRTLFMEMKKREFQAVLQTELMKQTANKIYDEMIDFAKYAFNKSHAAAYAVVSYQTAYLKYYYPVEFMAALMTSVIDFPIRLQNIFWSADRWGLRSCRRM